MTETPSTPAPFSGLLGQLSARAAELLTIARNLARLGITQAAKLPPEVTGPAREDAAAAYLEQAAGEQVEHYDALLPVIGAYMDLPLVDLAEKFAVRLVTRSFVKQVFTSDVLNNKVVNK